MAKEMTFEEALLCLEDITKRLESGAMPLDEAISAYESAVKLIKLCNSKLEKAEKKVKILLEGAGGAVLEDFERGNED